MAYRIETYDAGVLVARLPLIHGTEERAIEAAKGYRTPDNVTFIRVIQVESETDTNGPEIWSERRDA
jgi:hypothetical protein